MKYILVSIIILVIAFSMTYITEKLSHFFFKIIFPLFYKGKFKRKIFRIICDEKLTTSEANEAIMSIFNEEQKRKKIIKRKEKLNKIQNENNK